MAGEFEVLKQCGEIRWVDGGHQGSLPAWARWFIEVGVIPTLDVPRADHRRWIITSVPDRRFASSLCAHGIVCARASIASPPDVQTRFANEAPSASFLTWLDSNGHSRFGRFLGIRGGLIHYQPRDHGGWGPPAKRDVGMAGSFWPAQAEAEFVGPHDPANHSDFALAATRRTADEFLAYSEIDTVIVGVKTEIEQDLTGATFAVDSRRGTLMDTVRPHELVATGQHYRSCVMSSSSSPDVAGGKACSGPAIFDGPSGYLRHRDRVESHTCVVILDRWQPQSEEAANTARIERNETWVDAPEPPLPSPPAGIEVFQWTEEL